MPIVKPSVQIKQPLESNLPPKPINSPSLWWAAAWWPKNSIPLGDLKNFPDLPERAERCTQTKNISSIEFRRALMHASRLLILDSYFDDVWGTPALKDALWDSNNLTEIRINGGKDVSAETIAKEQDFLADFLASTVNSGIPIVEWRNTLPMLAFELHDRFAIIDNELWHFGATVGGMHRSVNAFSRGWDANSTGAVQFFEDVWSHS